MEIFERVHTLNRGEKQVSRVRSPSTPGDGTDYMAPITGSHLAQRSVSDESLFHPSRSWKCRVELREKDGGEELGVEV